MRRRRLPVAHLSRVSLALALVVLAPANGRAQGAAPPPAAFHVLPRAAADGPRITPYLERQLDLAWAQDAARLAAWAAARDEAGVRRLQAETRAKALALIGGLPCREDPAARGRDRHGGDGRLPHREAGVREPAGAARDGRRLRARRPGGREAGGASPVRPLARRQGAPGLPGDRRPPGAARLRGALVGPRRPGRAQPVLGRVARAQPLQPGVRRARGARQPRDARRDEPRALRGVGRHARGRLPAHPRRRRPAPAVDHRDERRRLPVGLDRRARRADRRRGAVLLRHVAADAHGEPHLRGPRQRPRAGPARPRLRGRRPRGAAAARLAAARPRGRRGEGLRADRGRTAHRPRAARALRTAGAGGAGRLRAGLPRAPLLGGEPGAGLRVPRPLERPARPQRTGGSSGAAARVAAGHGHGPGARGPAGALARRGDPRRRAGGARRAAAVAGGPLSGARSGLCPKGRSRGRRPARRSRAT